MNESKQRCTCTENLGHFTQKFSAELLSSRPLQLGVSHGCTSGIAEPTCGEACEAQVLGTCLQTVPLSLSWEQGQWHGYKWDTSLEASHCSQQFWSSQHTFLLHLGGAAGKVQGAAEFCPSHSWTQPAKFTHGLSEDVSSYLEMPPLHFSESSHLWAGQRQLHLLLFLGSIYFHFTCYNSRNVQFCLWITTEEPYTYFSKPRRFKYQMQRPSRTSPCFLSSLPREDQFQAGIAPEDASPPAAASSSPLSLDSIISSSSIAQLITCPCVFLVTG